LPIFAPPPPLSSAHAGGGEDPAKLSGGVLCERAVMEGAPPEEGKTSAALPVVAIAVAVAVAVAAVAAAPASSAPPAVEKRWRVFCCSPSSKPCAGGCC